ncbi:recombinase family protein, partial [Flavonifractor plautii]|uniref:recombinase family protein n=1 Tax=Flavonifractor plautii TaxID=292800 RepID=UPI00384C2EEC
MSVKSGKKSYNFFGFLLTLGDDGYSGASFNRPDFQRMMADMEDGKIGIIITKDLSRL